MVNVVIFLVSLSAAMVDVYPGVGWWSGSSGGMFSCQRQTSRLRLSDVVTPGHSLSRDVVVNGGVVELLLAPLLLDHVLELVLETVQVGRAVDVLGGRRNVLDKVSEQRLALIDGLGVAAVVVLVGRVRFRGPRLHVLKTPGRGKRLLP